MSTAAGDPATAIEPVPGDRLRSIVVAVLAVTQVVAAPLTPAVLGSEADTGRISDDNVSPLTPAGYAFAVWGPIYLACLALAAYQLLSAQRSREIHRRTGWYLAGAFGLATVWVPIFGSGLLWLAQLVILGLAGALATTVMRFTAAGPAPSTAERLLLRLPSTFYLGWAFIAAIAGFGTTARSLGMPERARWVTVAAVVLLALAGVVACVVTARALAATGFVLTSGWALVAVALQSPNVSVAITAWAAGIAVVATFVARLAQSERRPAVAWG